MAEGKAQTGGDQDPSMEEILQSIRRIIAEDNPQGGAENGEAADLSTGVLELTEMVQDDGSIVSTSDAYTADFSAEPPADVLASIDDALAPAMPEMQAEPEIVAAPPPPPPPSAPPPAPAVQETAVDEFDALISEETAAASAAALKKLNQPKPLSYTTTASMAFRSGTTVEDLVLEALRPMLKDWLDANLTGMVEAMVEREIKKLRDE